MGQLWDRQNPGEVSRRSSATNTASGANHICLNCTNARFQSQSISQAQPWVHSGFNNASRSSLAAGESGTFLRETNSYGSLREVMGSGSVVVKP
jgi:hypothetical protein